MAEPRQERSSLRFLTDKRPNGAHFDLRSLRLVTIYGQSDHVWLQEDPSRKEEYLKPGEPSGFSNSVAMCKACERPIPTVPPSLAALDLHLPSQRPEVSLF
jgi:hypothetical protein